MYIAHMPAGYLVGSAVAQRWPGALAPAAWIAILPGSAAPDYVLVVVLRRFDLWWLNFLTLASILVVLVISTRAVFQWRRRRSCEFRTKRVDFSAQFPKRPYRTFL
jgi:hypothetical protein